MLVNRRAVPRDASEPVPVWHGMARRPAIAAAAGIAGTGARPSRERGVDHVRTCPRVPVPGESLSQRRKDIT